LKRNTFIVSLVCAAPLVVLVARAATGRLSPNPIEDVTHVTGEWALRWLLATLAITPLRRFTGWSALAPQRRTLGLASFAYACLHMLTWAVLDQGLHGPSIADDLLERPYIWLGASAFVALLPLAATSTRAAMRRLGPRWRTLHKATYLALVLALAHYAWLVKADERGPLAYAAVAAVLLGLRFVPATPRRARSGDAARR
jgi:sulfoxide reductase heme-binding subunit YedZ